MRRSLLSFILVFSSFLIATAQSEQKINVTFFGSSVCSGSAAENQHGYGWQVFKSGAVDTLKYKYFNASTGGDNTLRVVKQQRFTEKLYPTDPDIVVIGLSLANEGIMKPQDNNGREQILEQFRSRLLAMADSLDRQGIKPVIVNCYAQSYFTPIQYEFTKRMNRLINTWQYPSVNVLGTIDDLKGRWVEDYAADAGHPNTVGHIEMSYAIVPSLFDAILEGKKTPSYDWDKSYSVVLNEEQIEDPIYLEVENTIHSFTMSFRFKVVYNGTIAGFTADRQKHAIHIDGHTISYKDLSAVYPKHLKSWNHVVLSHSYANGKTMLFANGEFVGSVKEQLVPTQIHFGGTSPNTELKDLAIHRASLNEHEALDLYNKKFIQSSLEFYNPLTKGTDGSELENMAQSMTKMKINKRVKLENKVVPLY